MHINEFIPKIFKDEMHTVEKRSRLYGKKKYIAAGIAVAYAGKKVYDKYKKRKEK